MVQVLIYNTKFRVLLCLIASKYVDDITLIVLRYTYITNAKAINKYQMCRQVRHLYSDQL